MEEGRGDLVCQCLYFVDAFDVQVVREAIRESLDREKIAIVCWRIRVGGRRVECIGARGKHF